MGLKRGLPMFASTSQNTALSNRIPKGLRTIRRRRLMAFLVPLAWLPVAATVLPRMPEKLLPTIFFLTATPIFAFFFIWTLSACPRCEQYFLSVLRFRPFASLKRCHNCGLGLHDA